MKKILLLLLCPFILSAQKSKYDKIEKYMEQQSEINRFGGTVIVMKNDSVILKKAYGKANLEWDISNTVDTKFVLASVTKYFTAIATMQLIEQAKLSVTDKLSKFYPAYPKADQVTIHMLLTHTAGLPLDFDELYMNSTSISKDSAIHIFQKKSYLFEPGTNCKYSNIGYFLLAQIIEKAAGQTYDSFLRQNIFDKAGMSNSGVCNNDSIVPKKANIYYKNGKGYAMNPYINWNLNVGHDGAYSTVEDLYKLDRALYNETILKANSRAIMETPYNKKYPDDNFFENYGYGIFINPYYNHGHHLLTHSGGFIGTMTTFDRYPKDNAFIAVLSNNESESHMISYGLAGILFDADVELPYHHIAMTANANISRLAGKYDNLEFLSDGKTLFLNSLETELVPESNTKFFRKDNPDRTFEFLSDKKGKINAVRLTKGGVRETKKRNSAK